LYNALAHHGTAANITWSVRKHPSYEPLATANLTTEKRVEWLEQQVVEYSNAMKEARICLVSPSIFGYSVMKYSELAMSGCLLLGGIPHDRSPMWKKFVVETHSNMSDYEILNILKVWLRNDEERIKRATLGQDLVKKSFTWERTFDHIIFGYERVLNNAFGIFYPYPFEIKCAAHDNFSWNSYCHPNLTLDVY